MLMDLETLDWDEDLLALFNVPRMLLPEIHPSAEVFGETTAGLELGRPVPVAGALGDQQSALFAQACFGPGLAKNTYGTGSFLLENTGTERLRAGGLLDTVAFSRAGRAGFVRAGRLDLRDRICGAVAARRPRDHQLGRRDGGSGGEPRRQR